MNIKKLFYHLDGWSFMLISPEKDFALLYFENKAALPTVSGLKSNSSYSFRKRMRNVNVV